MVPKKIEIMRQLYKVHTATLKDLQQLTGLEYFLLVSYMDYLVDRGFIKRKYKIRGLTFHGKKQEYYIIKNGMRYCEQMGYDK